MATTRGPGRRRVLQGLAAIPLAGLAACAAGRQTPQPDVAIENIRPEGGNLFAQRIAVTLRVTNPLDRDLTLTGLRTALNVNGRRLAQGVSNERLTIPRLSSRTVTVAATATTLDLMRQIFGLAQDQSLDYALEGALFLANFPDEEVAFSQSGELAPTSGGRDGAPALAPRQAGKV